MKENDIENFSSFNVEETCQTHETIEQNNISPVNKEKKQFGLPQSSSSSEQSHSVFNSNPLSSISISLNAPPQKFIPLAKQSQKDANNISTVTENSVFTNNSSKSFATETKQVENDSKKDFPTVDATMDSHAINNLKSSMDIENTSLPEEDSSIREYTDDDIILNAQGLCKTYHGRKVVNDVNLVVHRGEVVGLLGPNGAGKTTSFYMITGLIKPDIGKGKVFFAGKDISRLPMFKRSRMGMGYLAQEPSIFRKLSVEDNILAILQTLDISSAERKRRLNDLLDSLNLSHLRKQKAMTLSGGERRRLEITRALVTHPSFIMLDEPFSGVDPLVVYEIQTIIRQLRDRGLGILITDHNVRETLSCVDRAYLMANGRVHLEGSAQYLMNSEEARKIYLGPAFTL